MSHAALRARDLTCSHRGGLELGPLSFEIPQGSWTRILGPSGCGKTTLLRLIAGLMAPRAGELDLFGAPASRASRLLLAPEQRGIGMVFQGAGAGLWPHLGAQATLEFVYACRGLKRAEQRQRARELLARMQLCGKEERRPGELSGGEAARLALARALAAAPRLLLLDEPLGALDGALRGEMIRILTELHAAGGLTILHVTHDPAELDRLAGKTLRLEQGRLVGENQEV
jgi:ABC-type Fe3+/spermidine/putrescine transport system ATPase subunit